MQTGYPNQENVLEEADTMQRTWWPSGQRVRETLAIAVAVATVLGVLWGIGLSVISRMEERLMDRMETYHRDLSTRIDGEERVLSAEIGGVNLRIDALESGVNLRIDSLERGMVEGFRQSHKRMDRIEADIDRIEGDIDRIEGDIDRIESHLLRMGTPAEPRSTPAVAAPPAAMPE